MGIPRWIYVIFYVIYLILVMVSLYYLLHYTNVPVWVWSFYAAAILIFLIGVLIKELFVKKVVDESGKTLNNTSLRVWGAFYLIFHIIAIVLLIVGLVLTMHYSDIDWWIWLLLVIGLILTVIANMITSLPGKAITIFLALPVWIIGFIILIVGIAFYVVQADAPVWVWIIVIIAIIFGIMSSILDNMSSKNVVVKHTEVVNTIVTPTPSKNIEFGSKVKFAEHDYVLA